MVLNGQPLCRRAVLQKPGEYVPDMKIDHSMMGPRLCGGKLALQNRTDHGGHEPAWNHSVEQDAGLFRFAGRQKLQLRDCGV